jgi:hypothetical protein
MESVISKNKDLIEISNSLFPGSKNPVKEFAIQRTYDFLHTGKQAGRDPLKILNDFAGKKWLRISDEKNFVKTGEELPDVVKKFLGEGQDVRTSILTTAADLISFTSLRRVFDETADRALKDGLLFKNSDDAFNIGRIPYERQSVIAEDMLNEKLGSKILGRANNLVGDKQVVAAIMGRSRFDPSSFFKLYQGLLVVEKCCSIRKNCFISGNTSAKRN